MAGRFWIPALAVMTTLLVITSLPLQASTPDLLKDLQEIASPEYGICLPAIERLGRSGGTTVAPALATALGIEQRPVVRRYLVDALGLLKDPDATPALIQALKDPNAQLRQSAVLALERVATPQAKNALFSLSDTETDLGVKSQLIGAFGRFKDSQSRAKLKILTQDQDPEVQRLSTKALAGMKK